MTPLEQLHADQHDDLVLESDHALAAFLNEVSTAIALQDRIPRSEIELRHLARARRSTP